MSQNKKTKVETLTPVNVEFKLEKFSVLTDFVRYYSSPWKIFFSNFLAGTAYGLGFIIGAALLVTIIAYILGNVLANVPIVGQFFAWLNDWLATNLQSYQK
ncbi:MAG: hypothetical protein ACD_51C00115G0005 [uncultured bacterium]|nr:MAG: hypothetical protein ACD_51C00115G0005 [uncultured bacterium]OGJ47221.1 MAG: hypothetical protein A2244_00015 [Candidatus Peregrinibacteria bacterium RIFOXYA2_FULL_41_18]OGJ49176.1 MAG: hypothetical protein A2344_04575 [Candidatus Peregrinibacteria bacterium RIFOXYB12_FULL_41_12]OGJ52896.1 MAG: hypothetical protein A2448_02710 [Candidatus Peregrinibacteria bacterium RIFOXYC2_FULL_41_22]OGJ55249.1 MAG: hypothetical protein A2336_05055 [Candidatus Peregrinibacteria bacterium RIFOXYB2_FULL